MSNSLVLLNTGDGKGKSTAAFGVIVRAVARGWPVKVIQFLKSERWLTGEEQILQSLGVKWLKGGEGFVRDPARASARERALETWEAATRELKEGSYRLLVLDEITLPISLGWLSASEVAQAVRERAPWVNVILTGRQAPPELIEVADTATEMVKIRHAYDKGVLARAGIDF
ncbi:MAG: cob(I)yrinic acid a,c-diamide adenosyltransferase [Anaerolineae bacterium]